MKSQPKMVIPVIAIVSVSLAFYLMGRSDNKTTNKGKGTSGGLMHIWTAKWTSRPILRADVAARCRFCSGAPCLRARSAR